MAHLKLVPRSSIWVLVVLGFGIAALPTSAFLPAPASVGWTSTASMGVARHGHTATLLPDGRVLVVGGRSSGSPFSSCEIFDPGTESWSGTNSLGTGVRAFHDAILLSTGKVLVAGGFNGSSAYSGCELFDSVAATWATTGSMTSARMGVRLIPLQDGKILGIGGDNTAGSILSSCEIYDPAAGTWAATGSMSVPRVSGTATALADGRVFVTGGVTASSTVTDSCDIYDPTTGSWTPTAAIPTGSRFVHTGTLLPDGRVLITGGQAGGASFTSCVVFDPDAETWSNTASLSQRRDSHFAVLLPTGKVLVVGGANNAGFGDTGVLSGCEMYDPAAGTWSAAASIPTGGGWQIPGVLLASGKLLAPGAYQYGSTTSACAIFDWGAPPPAPTPQEVIGEIVTEVDDLVATDTITPGQGNSLRKKLVGALKLMESGGNLEAIEGKLEAFVNEVTALVNAGTLSAEEGDALIDAIAEVLLLLDP